MQQLSPFASRVTLSLRHAALESLPQGHDQAASSAAAVAASAVAASAAAVTLLLDMHGREREALLGVESCVFRSSTTAYRMLTPR